jgi:antitoxin (DNA-binding transcriptional repressor) of toxin-antitoxin stability system
MILDSVAGGEEVTITRHGKPVAVIVRPDALRVRRAEGALESAAQVRELIETSRHQPLEEGPFLTRTQADSLVRDVRSGRSRSHS